jgi:hypothetical protein
MRYLLMIHSDEKAMQSVPKDDLGASRERPPINGASHNLQPVDRFLPRHAQQKTLAPQSRKRIFRQLSREGKGPSKGQTALSNCPKDPDLSISKGAIHERSRNRTEEL